MQPNSRFPALTAVIIIALLIAGVRLSYSFFSKNPPPAVASKTDSVSSNVVELSAAQLNAIKIEPVGTYRFSVEKKTVGSVAYHEQDTTRKWLPGSAAVPDAEKNRSIKLVVANVSESDSPLIHVGQHVTANVAAYPDHVFSGRIVTLGGTIWDSGGNPAVDPNTRRITVRCEFADPKNELYPGMFANIAIQVQEPVESVAIPVNGVVRKGDGTMTAWVTRDHKRFEERTVRTGAQQDGYDQILDGLNPGELVVTDGAVFISNILYAPPSD